MTLTFSIGLRALHCRQMNNGSEGPDTEVRISCPDATGLGCDVARMLFDFGLRILEGEITDLNISKDRVRDKPQDTSSLKNWHQLP